MLISCVAWTPLLLVDLGLGATEAQDTLRKGIVSGEGAASPVGDACLLADYTTAAEVNGKNVAFIGQGNYAACKQSIVTHVVQTQHPCKWRHCAFNGVFQPTLTAGDLHLNKEFYELSAFIFTVRVRPATRFWLLPQLLVCLLQFLFSECLIAFPTEGTADLVNEHLVCWARCNSSE